MISVQIPMNLVLCSVPPVEVSILRPKPPLVAGQPRMLECKVGKKYTVLQKTSTDSLKGDTVHCKCTVYNSPIDVVYVALCVFGYDLIRTFLAGSGPFWLYPEKG